MAIQWFPGHMHKARLEMQKVLPQVDLIIEILDARIPFSSANPMLEKLRGDKPCIKVLNKADLADPELTEQWQQYLESQQGVKTLTMTATNDNRRSDLIQVCLKLLPNKLDSAKKIQAMIMGIPNVGKSTLINTLAGRQIAKTGNEPAITKGQQRIKLDESIVLHDTPGVLWPNLENQPSAYRLAVTGSIKETAFENDDIALFAVEYLSQAYPQRLLDRYQLDQLTDSALLTLEQIAAKRGCLRAGGHIDLPRVSKILVSELRSGQLGELTLETPEMMLRELEAVELLREAKAAKKAERKQKSKRR
ncbi:ribosome biogenesis GTPase YlqF [Methylophaga lonarensis]|uniref:ribosome biogenesis GTPase YlqF n=1 Tax=Methylophaga lonarensis TaxID=999151 RepID=UPI003D28C659